jgi:hypothetical protein
MVMAYSTTQIQAGLRGVRMRGMLRRLESMYGYKCSYFQRRNVIRGLLYNCACDTPVLTWGLLQ